MKANFKNQSVRLMYDLYQEFDKGELNSALDPYRDHLSHDEQMGNHIIFCYIDMITEDHPLDLTYASLKELPDALNDLYEQFTKKYLPKKAMDQLTKILAAYLTVLALNMHDLDLKIEETDDSVRWGNRYRIAAGDQDLLPAVTKSASLDGENIAIHIDDIAKLYQDLTDVDLKEYLDDFYLTKKVS